MAVTNCLNFGSPEDPAVMWQFAEAVRGLADGCQELGIPVTGGNVSFYNQTGAAAIHPTPVVGVLGVLDDVATRVPMGFAQPATGDGDLIFLLGETNAELSGSEWAWVTHEHLGGVPPKVDLARERALAAVVAEAARVGHLSAAHDLSDGGLAQALVESCLRNGVGARVALPEEFAAGSMPFVFLFSESAGRAMVAVPRGHERAFTGLCAEHGLPWTPIGVTDGQIGAVDVRGQFSVGLDELRAAHTGTMPALFGGPDALVATAVDDFAAADAPADEDAAAATSESDGRVQPVAEPSRSPSPSRASPSPPATSPATTSPMPRTSRSRRVSRRSMPSWPRPPRATTPPETQTANPEAPTQVDEAAETDGELEKSSGVAEVDAEIEAETAPPDSSDGAAKN